MLREKLSIVRHFMHGTAWSVYHIVVVALSAGIALSLPTVARRFLILWSLVENNMIYLVAVEMTAAIVLIVTFNYLHRGLRDRTLGKMATCDGLSDFFALRVLRVKKRVSRFK